tara:strand:- start:115 stop:369 length:255 start_codon:yes stop_codon:yes gene_type:complete
MNKLSKINDQLMGLSVSELGQVSRMIDSIKTLKSKSSLFVGQNVFVVQKTKKTPGVVEKINQTRALVKMRGTLFNVPFTMLEAA